MRFLLYTAIFSLLLLFNFNSFAQAKASPDDIKKVEEQIGTITKKKADLDKAKKQQAKKLAHLKKTLISQTKKLQKKERDLIDLNKRLNAIEHEINQNIKALSTNKTHNAQLMLAAYHVAAVPPEIMVIRPGSPVEFARTRMILKSTLPAMHNQAKDIETRLKTLEKLQVEMRRKKALASIVKEDLRAKQKDMEKQLNKRKKLLATTSKDRRAQEKRIAELKRKSKDLKSLITALDKDPSLSDTDKSPLAAAFSKIKGNSFTMPVSGSIRTNYGEKSSTGKSEGVTVDSTPNAIVVAPYSGIVRFAGPFRSYKLMVIIEHKNGYHSLLAGLSEIYLPVGTKVLSGEPIGKLKGDQSTKVSLYYELRHNGKPTNPNKTHNISG